MATSAILRTLLYTLAQVVVVLTALYGPRNHDNEVWRLFAEARGVALAGLVFLMSVHDRVTRIKIRSVLDDGRDP